MKIVDPSFTIMSYISPGGIEELKRLENAARTCYKSEHLASDDISSARELIRKCIANDHDSVLEHVSISAKIVCDRGVSHELVRHRMASYSQESTRYCNYTKDRFDGDISFIKPFGLSGNAYKIWERACMDSEFAYFEIVRQGLSPQFARTVLNNSLKTQVYMTANLREWRHIFELRCSEKAHPHMRQIMVPMLQEFKKRIPVVFDDIN